MAIPTAPWSAGIERQNRSGPQGAVNFSLGTTEVLPLYAFTPWRCRYRQVFPILLFLDFLLLDLLLLDFLLLLDLILFFTFALARIAFSGLTFAGFAFLLDLLFLNLFDLYFFQIMLMKHYFHACSNINMRNI